MLFIIVKRGRRFVLLSRKTRKVLGRHATKAAAERQERAVQAAKHAGRRRRTSGGVRRRRR